MTERSVKDKTIFLYVKKNRDAKRVTRDAEVEKFLNKSITFRIPNR